MRSAAISILAAASLYLISLGIVALADRKRAFGFLRQFAQTVRANIIEMGCRLLVGLAFVRLAAELPAPRFFFGLGLVLSVSAIILLAAPQFHRRFADLVLPGIERVVPIIGLVALSAGIALAAILLPLATAPSSPY